MNFFCAKFPFSIVFILFLSFINLSQLVHGQESIIYKYRDIIKLSNENDKEIYYEPIKKYLGEQCFNELAAFYKNKNNKFQISFPTMTLANFNESYGKFRNGHHNYFYHYTWKKRADDKTNFISPQTEYGRLIDDCNVKFAEYPSDAAKMKNIYFDLRTWANHECFSSGIFGLQGIIDDEEFPSNKESGKYVGGLLYVASNPYSSAAYGDYLVTFEYQSQSVIYKLESDTAFIEEIKNKIESNQKLKDQIKLISSCSISKITHLLLEEAGVDLVYYTSNPDIWKADSERKMKDLEITKIDELNEHEEKFLGWFHLLNPAKIKSMKFLEMNTNSKNKLEIDQKLKNAGRENEILK
ncbi:MAG: hypothetical protein QE271_10930 [Bacteriovoracaceae bacterium]|nr:hypothetical protein [Bacteriovoracaceae bacterium]